LPLAVEIPSATNPGKPALAAIKDGTELTVPFTICLPASA
jgi:hypothetical protein